MPTTHLIKAAARRAVPSPLYQLYRKQHHAYEIRRYGPRTVTHSYGGVNLTVSLEDGLAEGWYDRNWDEPTEIRMLKRNGLVSGARVFDLGAHQAVFALMIAREVGPAGTVVAVEAEAHNYEVACRNVSLNGADNVRMVHAAVAERSGSVWFTEGLNGCVQDSTSRVGKANVRAVTVDELVQEFGAPDVVLIDVEGYEAKALLGAGGTLSEVRPRWLIEVHEPEALARAGNTSLDVLARLEGYQVSVADESGDFNPLEEASHLLDHRCWLFADPA